MTNRQLLLKAATTSQLVGRIVDERLAPVGVPGFLVAVLTHVEAGAPISPSSLSAASGMPPTTLRDNIQRLVDRGLIRRVPNPTDGRSYLLVPTSRGTAVTEAAGAALHEAYLELERLLPRALAEYERTLDEINGAILELLAAPTGREEPG